MYELENKWKIKKIRDLYGDKNYFKKG
jgi:hypothetical protein